MIRPSVPVLTTAALVAMCLSAFSLSAQTQVPTAPEPAPYAGARQAPSAPAVMPSAPFAASTAPAFPKVSAADFTATSPTLAEVNAFLEANWGYDPNRVWQVQAILKTPVEGVSKIIVLVAEKTGGQKPGVLLFYTLPDGQHLITGNDIVAFGAHPFASARATLEQLADGPFRGSASKDLELVEFADFQCPHCKDAQANMDKLATDFPQARIVFQNSPIASVHPEAVKAAEYGVCVDKLGGSTAFFKFATAVFNGQAGLATPDGATLALNSAATAAGQDPSKVAACAATAETAASVASSIKLSMDLGIQAVPTLMINGRGIPADAPYDVLKNIVAFQAKLDGVPLTQ